MSIEDLKGISAMIDRRAARSTFKEEPDRWVIYSARLGDLCWVGATPRMAALENRLSFELKMGKSRLPGVEQAGAGHALVIEVLEALPPELGPLARSEVAGEKCAAWAARLGGTDLHGG